MSYQDSEIMYYVFVDGQPKLFFETEEDCMDYIRDLSWELGIPVEDLNYEIKPFTEFNEEFPDPYDEYDF